MLSWFTGLARVMTRSSRAPQRPVTASGESERTSEREGKMEGESEGKRASERERVCEREMHVHVLTACSVTVAADKETEMLEACVCMRSGGSSGWRDLSGYASLASHDVMP